MFFLHISLVSLDLYGQLLNSKIALPTATNWPDATALTENAINWLRLPKNIKILFRNLQKLPIKAKMANLGGFLGPQAFWIDKAFDQLLQGSMDPWIQGPWILFYGPAVGLSTPRAPKELLPKFQKNNVFLTNLHHILPPMPLGP